MTNIPLFEQCSDFFRAFPGAGLGDFLLSAWSLSANEGLGAPDPRARYSLGEGIARKEKIWCKMGEVFTPATKIQTHLRLSEMLVMILPVCTMDPALQSNSLFGGCWYLREAP